jgi:hypothetical protein
MPPHRNVSELSGSYDLACEARINQEDGGRGANVPARILRSRTHLPAQMLEAFVVTALRVNRIVAIAALLYVTCR